MANIHICVWQHSAWESDFKEQFIRKQLAILSSAPYVCANYDTFYTFQLCTYFLWSIVALYRNCFVELTLHQTPSFTKQTLFAIKWVFMKLTPSQSLVRWRWNGPTFPNMSCAGGLAVDRYQKSHTGEKITSGQSLQNRVWRAVKLWREPFANALLHGNAS